MKKELMSPDRLAASLALADLSDPQNGPHAINIIVEKIQHGLREAFTEASIKEVRVNPEVSVIDNFDNLLFPADNAGRSSRYTRYVTPDTVLRTHTSAAIPSWLKTLTKKKECNAIIVLPGMCYRRDVVDKTHCGEPHQMDVWWIKKGKPAFKRSDLLNFIEVILHSIIPECPYRANEVKHPYTINGLEIEALVKGNWLEILECGEAHPQVLKNAGLSPQEYSGLALGMGLDRLVMIIKEIDDIRILRSADLRIKRQLMNLEKFIPVSHQPPTKRVLSYSTFADKTEEDTCEEIRDELGPNSNYIEEIHYEEILFKDLHEKAKQNLGIRADQKNVIATITFRSLEESLPKTKVNEWVQKLYPKLNKGDRGYM